MAEYFAILWVRVLLLMDNVFRLLAGRKFPLRALARDGRLSAYSDERSGGITRANYLDSYG